jgi:hypothetical protein
MTVEQRLDQLEKRNKRLTVALTGTAATGLKDSVFDAVTVQNIYVKNDAGEAIVGLGATDSGDGLVLTNSAKGKNLVMPRCDSGLRLSLIRSSCRRINLQKK